MCAVVGVKYDSVVSVLHNIGLLQMCKMAAELLAATSAVRRPSDSEKQSIQNRICSSVL